MSDLNEFLATERVDGSIKDWNPRENIEQAMLLLDKVDEVSIVKGEGTMNAGYWECWVNNPHDFVEAETLAEAICLAVAKASGCWGAP